jgi:predicted alpha-1,2-mannosidase
LIDTANRRFFFFSSACRPFGMVNLSPDTVNSGAWGSGYRYTEPYVLWFSHVHAWQLSGIPVLPTTGTFRGHQGSDVYRSHFSHDDEVVCPGYHALTLQDYGVRAELTATDRVGFHRYTFPQSEESHILFDLGTEVGPSRMSDAAVRRVGDSVLEGYVENDATRRRPKPTRIYFVAVFDRPFGSFGAWQEGEVLDDVDLLSGPGGGVFVRYETAQDEAIQLKVALSYCGLKQARRNLEAELLHWNFDRVRRDAEAAWDRWLGRIGVQGGTEAQRTKFYTDLYHALLGRRRVSDVDGTYLDMTGDQPVVRQIDLDEGGKPRYEHHNSDAFWGAQWTLNVLWPMAYPQVTHNFCNTLVDVYKNGGLIPRGPTGGNYSFVMVSPTSTPLLVSAYQKGIRTFDVDAAYEGMVKNHGPGGLMSKAGYEHETCIGGGVEYYIDRGYVPVGIQAFAFHCSGATQTLEYAYCDWCLAQMARVLGKADDAQTFARRAQNYRNIYDPETGFMRPRTMDGSWLADFDPMSPEGWVEGNGWQYLWHVPHDVAGLIGLMGGRETFVRRLDEMMARAAEQDFIAPHGKHYLNYLDYGNQPSTYIAHLFNYAGAPWLTQQWVRRVMEQAKSDITPYGGYGGDEDQGQMGALNVLMAIGLFSVNGGCSEEPFYEVTSPIFDRIVIHLDERYHAGETFVIEVERASPGSIYIQSASLNGEPLDRPWFYHRDLVRGGALKLVLGEEPNKRWGSRPEDAPPSMRPD